MQREIDFNGLHRREIVLVHDDGAGVVDRAVEGAGVGGQFAHPLVVDVHARLHAVVGGGVALAHFDRLAVDADGVDLDGVAGQQVLAVHDAQRRKGQALRFLVELKPHGVLAGAGDLGGGRLHGILVAVHPEAAGPVGVGVHDVRHGCGGLLGHGGQHAQQADDQRQAQDRCQYSLHDSVPPPIVVRVRIYRFCRAAEKPVHCASPTVSPGRIEPATVSMPGRWVWGWSMASNSRSIVLRARFSASCR